MDRVNPETRSRMMAAVGSKNTKPEMTLRKALHARGFRYRIHVKDLPGKPDIVFPSRRSILFVHGCFWHGHDCPAGALPTTRREFWVSKIEGNKERDEWNIEALRSDGWRVMVVWECELRDAGTVDRVSNWLNDANSSKMTADSHDADN